MTTIRLPEIQDVEDDVDLLLHIKQTRKACGKFARELANTAGDLSAMLKAYDEAAKKRGRRKKVIRPLALAAGVMILVSKYLALTGRRFTVEYAEEIAAARAVRKGPRRRQAARRRFRFTGDAA